MSVGIIAWRNNWRMSAGANAVEQVSVDFVLHSLVVCCKKVQQVGCHKWLRLGDWECEREM